MAHNNGLAISRIIRGEAIQGRSADWLHQGCELRCSVLSIARLHAQRYHLGDHARSRYNLQHMGSTTACPVCSQCVGVDGQTPVSPNVTVDKLGQVDDGGWLMKLGRVK